MDKKSGLVVSPKKFNSQFKDIFPEPTTLHSTTQKVVGLDGSSKMSKSQNNYIGITEDTNTLWSKLATAATDPARVTRKDPGNPFICNIYSLHKLISEEKTQNLVIDGCKNAKIGCIDCKKILFNNLNSLIEPIREKYNSWISKPEEIKAILATGAIKANKVAQKTIEEVYDLIGFNY